MSLSMADLLAIFQSDPTRVGMILLAIAPAGLGVLLWVVLGRADLSTPAYKLRWLAFVPILFGIIVGVMKVIDVNTFTYQQYHLIGGRMKILHYATLAMPLIAGIGLLLLSLLKGSKPKYDF